QSWAAAPDAGMDPDLDSLPADGPSLLPEDLPAQISPAPTPMIPSMPSIPSFGAGAMPGGGALPGGTPGWAMPSGFSLPGPLQSTDDEGLPRELDHALPQSNAPEDEPSSDKHGDDQADHRAAESAAGEPPVSGPTTVTLPNGETVTAASPQLAAAIKA